MKVTIINQPTELNLKTKPFEFKIEDISISCLLQFANYNYIDKFNTTKYVIPDGIQEQDREKYVSFIETSLALYDVLEQSSGKEVAEYVLPNGVCCEVTSLMTTRELLYFFSMCCDDNTQSELLELACEMLKQVRELFPETFKYI
ncbi:FAD-dependent thymidylate synthase [Anaerovorax sp. IOR16]|uniref:FAD-dependent thymidylate synthase n=1 Tax=Anaerovorax sp. IOR16 TaxID=2773458 RepID=UPI0019D0F0BB|nr:FAD-dependent thymidylate synthase [Anaerovorax sp. IOR16]